MKLIVGGMMRSGTTLLQRVLDCHPEMSVCYQAYTKKFIQAMTLFQREKNIESYHVFNNYSDPLSYSFSELQDWLIKNLEIHDFLPESVVGDKEVLIEELYPFFLNKNAKCINVIRDPRDVIASMSFGNGYAHTGDERPILFDLRNWRKSVHIAYKCRLNKNFNQVSFEELVSHPDQVLKRIFEYLGLSDKRTDYLYESVGDALSWKGNSSFGEKKLFDKTAIGNFKRVLSSDVVNYIEAVCGPEMEYLGYSKSSRDQDLESIIKNFEDPFFVKRKEFPHNYSSCPFNVEYELKRIHQGFPELNESLLS